MLSTARKALAASLIALHAAIMLCGPGLHAAPGLGHPSASRELPKGDETPSLSTVPPVGGDHCPLCDFFAQGQLPAERPPAVADLLDRPAGPISRPACSPRPPILSSRSRAPPLSDDRIVPPTTAMSNPIPA